MLVARIALILGISIASLLISIILDVILAPLPHIAQFLVQIPLLVLAVDELRILALQHATTYGLTESQVNGAFFFAAPIAAFGATNLFADMARIIRYDMY